MILQLIMITTRVGLSYFDNKLITELQACRISDYKQIL